MLKNNATPDDYLNKISKQDKEFKKLLRHITRLANHKLGYPVSLLTYFGIIDNKILGINPGTLANVLLNNVGDPFVDSQTSLMEVKRHERKLIRILEKYYGLKRNEARGYVTTGGTEGNFASLWWSKRYLINSALPLLIETDDKIKGLQKLEQELTAGLVKIAIDDYKARAEHLQKIMDTRNLIVTYQNKVQQLLTPTVFYSKEATHYSVPKISELLRINIRPVSANQDGAINLDNFKKELIFHLGAHPFSAVIVIANAGTTITGAIDDAPGIKKILDEIKPKPIYTLHMDGALTGFVLPILKPFGDIPDYFDTLGVNTLVFSAHKYPGLSQPCGIILTKKNFLEKAFEKSERSIEYVGNIRDVTITGSRSGLNVLMFYNALYTLGLRQNTKKLRKMLSHNLKNARYLYEELVKIFGAEHVFYPHHFNIMFPKPSMAIAKKYQLMLTGDRATICVLTNVNKKLIDKFLKDLIADKEKQMKPNKAETPIQIKSDFTLQTMTAAHEKAATQVFVKCFCDSEPITKHLGIGYKEYTPFAKAVIQKAIKDGLSKVVLDKQGKVIGLVIAEDMADPFKPDLKLYPQLAPIQALLKELSNPFIEGKNFKKGNVLHTWIVAIDEPYRSKGLYKEIGIAHVNAAIHMGYSFDYSDFTNEISEKIVREFDALRLCNKINYDQFVYEGKKPFEGVKGAAASYLAVLKPNVNLESLENFYTIKEKLSSTK